MAAHKSEEPLTPCPRCRLIQERHLVFWAFVVMRWLIIALLVSLGALLLAAAGMARHILLHRGKDSSAVPQRDNATVHEETDLESEG
jgi:hypothetical protein